MARRVQRDNAAASCGQKKANMNRITQRDPIQATGKAKQLYELVRTELGVVPNLSHLLVGDSIFAKFGEADCFGRCSARHLPEALPLSKLIGKMPLL